MLDLDDGNSSHVARGQAQGHAACGSQSIRPDGFRALEPDGIGELPMALGRLTPERLDTFERRGAQPVELPHQSGPLVPQEIAALLRERDASAAREQFAPRGSQLGHGRPSEREVVGAASRVHQAPGSSARRPGGARLFASSSQPPPAAVVASKAVRDILTAE